MGLHGKIKNKQQTKKKTMNKMIVDEWTGATSADDMCCADYYQK